MMGEVTTTEVPTEVTTTAPLASQAAIDTHTTVQTKNDETTTDVKVISTSIND
jgi:hypothetical protein